MKEKKPFPWFRTLAVLICVGILGGVAAFGISAYVIRQGGKYILTPELAAEKVAESAEDAYYDCILILGCGVRPDGSPSPMLADRLARGFELYQMGVSSRILVSGDHGKQDYDEVKCMKSWLIEAGVPSEVIFMDHAGFSTYESMYRAKAIFQAERVMVVTQRYHLYRAIYAARALHLQADGVAAEEMAYGGWRLREFREILARDKEFFNCIVQPRPNYLGQTISLEGSGDVTND